MPQQRKQSRRRGRIRKWLDGLCSFLRKLRERLLRIAPGKAKPSAPRPRAARPGKWFDDSATSIVGRLDFAPFAPRSRDYRLYQPPKLDPDLRLIVVLHGCRQTADDIATGTRLNDHADERGWPALYPQQSKAANKWNCWNWFDPSNIRGHGEAATIVAMHDAVAKRYSIDGTPAFLAGMSAGGALASVLALRYPERWAAVAIHSGLPYSAADDPYGALRVMREGARNLTAARTLRVRSPDAPGIPAIILHGNADDVVDRRNADLLVRQFLGWNGYLGDAPWDTAELPKVDDDHVATVYGHPYVVRRYRRDGFAPVDECEVIGMGHAWAGGDAALPYHDALGPDASALMVQFFADAVAYPARQPQPA